MRTRVIDLHEPVKVAVAAIGGGTEMARKLGITKSAVSQWRRIPVERANEIAKLTGIPRHQLRPDIFGISEQSDVA